jgi:hypothetical protein
MKSEIARLEAELDHLWARYSVAIRAGFLADALNAKERYGEVLLALNELRAGK